MSDNPTMGETGGEFAFLQRVLEPTEETCNDPLPGAASVIIGPSTAFDGALLQFNGQVVATTDMLADGRHFRLDWINPYECGWRAGIASISDCAALGARPKVGFLSLGIPKDLPAKDAEAIVLGVKESLENYGAFLGGGDTIAVDGPVIINVCLLGESCGRVVGRGGAKVGDLICVTGKLGGSRGAIMCLENLGREQAWNDYYSLVKCYSMPHARVDAGVWLSSQPNVHAMMDISDGLSSDLRHFAQSGGVGIVLQPKKLPYHPELGAALEVTSESPFITAMHGGEDCELVFAIDPDKADGFLSDLLVWGSAQGTIVGRVVEQLGVWYEDDMGMTLPLQQIGFEHFPA